MTNEEREAKAVEAETHCGPGFAKKIRERAAEPTIERTERGVKLTAEAPHHDPERVETTLRRVAFVCLENRGALECALTHADSSNATLLAAELRDILDALDDWHTASLAVMQEGA